MKKLKKSKKRKKRRNEIFACGKCEMWPTGHVIYTVLRTGYLPEANMETLYRVYYLFNGEQY